MKQVKKLTVDYKLVHYRWLIDHITKNEENAPWVNREDICKHSLKFSTKAWWSVVRHCITPISNENILGITNAGMVASFIVEL